MGEPEPIDLRHQGHERTVASYLLETNDGPALFDCGPSSTIAALKEGLAARGLQLADVRHLLLSHIHLDHAGAAGTLVREHPALQVHVSEIGAPHLVDPERLESSARRLYGDAFDPLWGELAPVPPENVHVVGERVLGLDCFPTPGHASHHVCYLDRDGTLSAGDVAGVRIPRRAHGAPPTPPPDIDVDDWADARRDRAAPARAAGALPLRRRRGSRAPPRGAAARAVRLGRVRLDGASEEEFIAYCRTELADAGEDVAGYATAMPLWQSYRGLKRWADKQTQV